MMTSTNQLIYVAAAAAIGAAIPTAAGLYFRQPPPRVYVDAPAQPKPCGATASEPCWVAQVSKVDVGCGGALDPCYVRIDSSLVEVTGSVEVVNTLPIPVSIAR